jgi:hypothetical protein
MPANVAKPLAYTRDADAKHFVLRTSAQRGWHAAAEVLNQEPDVIVESREPEDRFLAARVPNDVGQAFLDDAEEVTLERERHAFE